LEFIKIKALIFDFDGVFTNNKVLVSETGKETVICNRSDGIGIEMLKKINIPMKIISSEPNKVVYKRAQKLKLPVAYNVKNKLSEMNSFLTLNNINIASTAYLGNDINDLDCMLEVGFPISVSDANKK